MNTNYYASGELARIDDAEEIAAVYVESWKAAYTGIVPSSYLDTLDTSQRKQMWLDLISQSKREILVARQTGRVGGFCHLLPGRDADRPSDTDVVALDVQSALSRHGLGRLLMERAVSTPPHHNDLRRNKEQNKERAQGATGRKFYRVLDTSR